VGAGAGAGAQRQPVRLGDDDHRAGGTVTDSEPALPRAAEAALVAALLMSAGSGVGDGLTLIVGLPLVCAGFIAAWMAAARWRRPPAARPFTSIYFLLSANAAVALSAGPPYDAARWYQIAYRAHPALAIVLVGVVAAGSARTRRVAALAGAASATALLLATPVAMPQPMIDVWVVTQRSIQALLQGVHPYTVAAPDVYGGGYDFGYTTSTYPYMPLTLLAGAPAVAWLGDYRFALALCFPIVVALLRSAGRRLAVNGHTIDVLTLALALQPRAAFVVAGGWLEPLLMAALAAFVYLSTRDPAGIGAATAFMLLPALKQYVVAPILIFVAMHRRRRSVWAGALVAAATAVPFLIWNARATLTGILAIPAQMRAPDAFRTDSTSLTALVAQVWGVRASPWLAVVAQIAAGGAAFAMLKGAGLGGVLLASALSLLASFLVGTQAFVGYYAFVVALLLCAGLVLSSPEPIAVDAAIATRVTKHSQAGR
jgi:hypothetical protein